MYKLRSLRDRLTAAVPELARDPERLVVLAQSGRVVTTGTASLSFEYAYTIQVSVLDYAGHADAIIIPVLQWVQAHQPELLANPDKRENAIRFAVDYLKDNVIDLGLDIDVTERVLVRPRAAGPDGALELHHVPEPPQIGVALQAEQWTLWLRDEKLAEWVIPAR